MLIQPSYFPNIETFQHLMKAENIIFEVQDYYQKQTYRTRCNIYSANGLLSMNIPIKHQKMERQYTKEVKIENEFPWQKNHFKTLQNAYRSSPFFEYYEDDIQKIYQSQEVYLIDFLFKTLELSYKLLQTPLQYSKTEAYHKQYTDIEDFRYLVEAKLETKREFPVYSQVFESKHGFLANLSILDLLFNEGPQARVLLK
jgi:hypothetical protein